MTTFTTLAQQPGFRAGLLCLFLALPAAAQTPDTTAAPPAPTALNDHSPQGALWRAAAVPGWGQLYNRQLYKIPVVYLALGGLAVLAVELHRDYTFYNCAYQYQAFEEAIARGAADENPRLECADEYVRLAAGRDVPAAAIEPIRNNRRRNRDLSTIGVGLVYALSVLDAYVNAHLLDFDVSDDLSVTVLPHPDGLAARIRVGL